jgi:hypothetical protein
MLVAESTDWEVRLTWTHEPGPYFPALPGVGEARTGREVLEYPAGDTDEPGCHQRVSASIRRITHW